MTDDICGGGQNSLDSWQQAMRVFEDWVDADAARQADLIARLAARDAAAHTHLLELIAADREAEGRHFLGADAIGDAQPLAEDAPPPDLAGERIGAWRLDHLLGAGGSGQVWLAVRCDGRHVGRAAIKLLRGTASDRQAQQRFAREGRLLARLQHAHIARLLDIGETLQGQRYLVLEYVDGERLDHWCDRHQANIETRLRLFLQVCDAAAYAHANLIVHRDLKPSNILVDGEGDAKLLDFGIAKLIEEDETGEAAELTRAGGAVFTPEYAAPEQFSGEPATAATDVYSLGVVLYLLLSGRRPYGEQAVTPAQFARTLSQREPPRLSAAAAEKSEDTEQRAKARGATAGQLRRSLRGDLETIVACALKLNPAERYATAQTFGDDVRRYLRHQPIRARADSSWYRARKFVRRHWVGVAATAACLIVAAIGVGFVLVAERKAQREAARAEAVQQFLIGLFKEADPGRAQGKTLAVRDLLARGEHDLRGQLDNEPSTKLVLLDVLGNIYQQLGDSPKAVELTGVASELAAKQFGTESLEYGDALAALADAQKEAGQLGEAEANYHIAVGVLGRHADTRAKDLAMISADLAFVYSETNREDEALHAMNAALPAIAKEWGEGSWEYAQNQSVLAGILSGNGQKAAALDVYAQLEPKLGAVAPEHALDAAVVRANQAFTLWQAGRLADCERTVHTAVAEFDRLTGPDNSYAVLALRILGSAYVDAGDYASAARTFDEAVTRAGRAYGTDAPEYALNQLFRANTFVLTGRAAEAAAAMHDAVQVADSKPGLTAGEVRAVKRRYGLSLLWSGDARHARELLEELARQDKDAPEIDAKAGTTLLYLAGARFADGDPRQAVATAQAAAERFAKAQEPDAQGLALLTQALATAATGQADAAQALVDEADAKLREKMSASHPKLNYVPIVRGQLLRAAGREQEADAIERPAREKLKRSSGIVLPDKLFMLY